MSMQLPEIIPDLKKYSFIYRMGMLFANLYGIIQLQQLHKTIHILETDHLRALILFPFFLGFFLN